MINRGDTGANRISTGANQDDTVINRGKPGRLFHPGSPRCWAGIATVYAGGATGLTRCRHGSPRLVAVLLRFGPVESRFNTVCAGSPRYRYGLDEITCN